jgi:hypothetical protein
MTKKNALYAKRIKTRIWQSVTPETAGLVGVVGSVCSIITFVTGSLTGNQWVLGAGYTVFALSLSAIAFYEVRQRKQAELRAARNRIEYKNKIDDIRLRRQKAVSFYMNKVARATDQAARVTKLLTICQRKSEDFHYVFHFLREANAHLLSKEFTPDKHALFKGSVGQALTHLVDFLSPLWETQCSSCVKLLGEDKTPIEVFTLVRDTKSKWRTADDKIKYELDKNTAFCKRRSKSVPLGGRSESVPL